jgi:hypothetical protein
MQHFFRSPFFPLILFYFFAGSTWIECHKNEVKFSGKTYNNSSHSVFCSAFDDAWKINDGCFREMIFSQWFSNFLNRETCKFWQFGEVNFDSLEREILTFWKGKFWQFVKEIFDSFRGTVNFLSDTQFGNHFVNVTVFCSVNLFLLSNQVSLKLTKIIQCSKNYMIRTFSRENPREIYSLCFLHALLPYSLF